MGKKHKKKKTPGGDSVTRAQRAVENQKRKGGKHG